jgi:hypothetical protein
MTITAENLLPEAVLVSGASVVDVEIMVVVPVEEDVSPVEEAVSPVEVDDVSQWNISTLFKQEEVFVPPANRAKLSTDVAVKERRPSERVAVDHVLDLESKISTTLEAEESYPPANIVRSQIEVAASP